MKQYILGIELGSTRIKSVLINEDTDVIAQGSYEWENALVEGLWSYSLEDVERGMQASYADLAANYAAKFGKPLTEVGAIGISAMMHGYLAFDQNDKLLVPFARGETPTPSKRRVS
jgi:sugar (pentulose or hexulose) kinase